MKPSGGDTRHFSYEAALQLAFYALLAMGTAALSYVAYVAIEARAYQAAETRKIELKMAQPAESQSTPVLSQGSAIGRIEIPRLGLAAIVVQGDSAAILRHAVGHIPGTPLPGQPGNVALAGHRDTFFRPLRDIQIGDTIMLQTPGGDYRYLVESTTVVPPAETEVLQSSSVRELTLVTCYPFHYIGEAPNRFIVRARELQPAP